LILAKLQSSKFTNTTAVNVGLKRKKQRKSKIFSAFNDDLDEKSELL